MAFVRPHLHAEVCHRSFCVAPFGYRGLLSGPMPASRKVIWAIPGKMAYQLASAFDGISSQSSLQTTDVPIPNSGSMHDVLLAHDSSLEVIINSGATLDLVYADSEGRLVPTKIGLIAAPQSSLDDDRHRAGLSYVVILRFAIILSNGSKSSNGIDVLGPSGGSHHNRLAFAQFRICAATPAHT